MKTLLKSLLFITMATFGVPVFAAPENHEEFARQYMPESQAVFERFRKECAETQKLRESLAEDLRVMNLPLETNSNYSRNTIFGEVINLMSRPLEGNRSYNALTQKILELETRESEWSKMIKDMFLKHKAGMITSEKLGNIDTETAQKAIEWENDVLKNIIKNSIETSGVPELVKIRGKNYAFGKYEVTQSQYATVMGTHYSQFRGLNNPAENVSWEDAVKFCALLTLRERIAGRISATQAYRLPTVEEWEHACADEDEYMGTTGSERLDKVAWHFSNTTHPVGLKAPNRNGLYDMLGNVGEWTASFYRNPHYALDAGRVCKGGAYMLESDSRVSGFKSYHFRCSKDGYGYANQKKRVPLIGFRVILDE